MLRLLLLSSLSLGLGGAAVPLPFDERLCGAGADGTSWRDVAALVNVSVTDGERRRLLVVMQVTDPIGGYGRLGVAVAAAWAQRHGYDISVHAELPGGNQTHPVPLPRDHRFGKVALLRRWAAAATHDWLLWLDSDVFILDQGGGDDDGGDWTARLISELGGAHDMIASGEFWIGDGLHNSGVMLLRASAWTEAMLAAWWEHPAAVDDGQTDQLVFQVSEAPLPWACVPQQAAPRWPGITAASRPSTSTYTNYFPAFKTASTSAVRRR